MELAKVTMEITPLSTPEERKPIEFQIDTGAMITNIPRSLLEELGIEPQEKKQLRNPEGQLIEKDIGYAFLYYNNKRAIATVVFDNGNGNPVIGHIALSNLGLEYNSQTGNLEPINTK